MSNGNENVLTVKGLADALNAGGAGKTLKQGREGWTLDIVLQVLEDFGIVHCGECGRFAAGRDEVCDECRG